MKTPSTRFRPAWPALALALTAGAAQAQMTGDLERCPAHLAPTTPDAHFQDAGPGLVLHQPTGLIWKRCSEGQTWDPAEKTCQGEPQKFRWEDAQAHIQALNAQADPASRLGHTDWRMPTLRELQSIVEYACRAPAINLQQFPKTGGWLYWSATPVTGFTRYAWGVYFEQGNTYWYSQRLNQRMRLVRSAAATPAAPN